MSHNLIDGIDGQFRGLSLKNLEALNLEANQISSIALDDLPNLKILNLRSNPLKELPEKIQRRPGLSILL